ncbi:MAG TPA: tRNA (adenosine(37)-N6)-threonylcarbamoyltransferase complex ATPase subunit type 1 TsaE [Actinomycetota bacterium]|jgi:tRNA threonylcarbamoyladenosine biosynthesis protein TsaE|nr:tRNA (adenosine(37)-N6)-threonylcarbamoyltransferase complex ATPase subunit type 1 TsaE [Actinomycetota bacterium]
MSRKLDLVTRAPEETRELGAALADLLVPGDVISLTGDLGAGKTCLVQGAARSLGVQEPVGSPTFVLVREYRGEIPVYHLDVYRLDRLQEVLDLGFEDLLDPGGVIFIEWGDAIDPLLPDSYLEVELSISGDDEMRLLAVTGRGSSWAPRWERLEKVLDTWRAA